MSARDAIAHAVVALFGTGLLALLVVPPFFGHWYLLIVIAGVGAFIGTIVLLAWAVETVSAWWRAR